MQRFTAPVPAPSAARRLLDSLPAAERPALWLADRWAATAAVRSSGYAALDAELPGGGWPRAGLTELLAVAPGCGEWRLLAPLLSPAGPQAGSVLCVAPPLTPYAPALQALSLALPRLLVVQPDSLADAAWAAEQGLRSGACEAVLWWLTPAAAADGALAPTATDAAARAHPRSGPRPHKASAAAVTTALRRLHLASLDAACPLFALRSATAQRQSSPAPLRLLLEPAMQGQVAVTVFKRRGPPMPAPLMLKLPVSGLPARRGLHPVQAPAPARPAVPGIDDAVVRAAPERIAA